MRVLWTVNIPFPPVVKKYNLDSVHYGGWLTSLADVLKNNYLRLGILWAYTEVQKLEKFNEENVNYYILPSRKPPIISRVHSFEEQIRWCIKVIDDFQPDVIAINGTEYFYGLVSNQTNIPIIVDLQGIVNEIKKYYFGRLKLHEIIRYPWIIKDYWRFCQRCIIEREIFRRNKIFSGRTLWDESVLREYTTDFIYNHVERVLRPQFYKSQWDISKIQRYVIYSTSKMTTYKGVDILLKALRIIKINIPGIQLKLAGNLPNHRFGCYLHTLIRKFGLNENVSFLGQLNANEVAKELCRSHIYVLPSFIENSPNSLAEAQIIGVPCVAAYTGGVPSYVEEGKTGLLFPRGDHAVLAKRVLEIIENDDLAINLSRQARKTAQKRHDPQKIANNCINIYKSIVEDCNQ